MIELLTEIAKSIIATTIDRLFFNSYFGSLVFAISFAILEWGVRKLKDNQIKLLTPSKPQSILVSSNTFLGKQRYISIIGALLLTAIFLFTPPVMAVIPGLIVFIILIISIILNFVFIGLGVSNSYGARKQSPNVSGWNFYCILLGLFLLIVSITWLIQIRLQYPDLDMSGDWKIPSVIAEAKYVYVQALIFLSTSVMGLGIYLNTKVPVPFFNEELTRIELLIATMVFIFACFIIVYSIYLTFALSP